MKNLKTYGMGVMVLAFLSLNAVSLALQSLKLGGIIDALQSTGAEAASLFYHELFMFFVYSFLMFIGSSLGWKVLFRMLFDRTTEVKNQIFASDLKRPLLESFDSVDYSANMELIFTKRYLSVCNIVNLSLIFLASVITVASIHLVMLPVVFVATAIPLLLPFLIKKPLEARSSRFVKSSKDYQAYVLDRLNGRRELRRFHVFAEVIQEHQRLNQTQENDRIQMRSLINLAKISGGFLSVISMVIVFFVGGVFTLKGLIGLGAMMAVIQLMNFLLEPVVQIVNFIHEYRSTQVIYDKIMQGIKEKKADDVKAIQQASVTLVAEGISYAYPEAKAPVIQDFTDRFLPGEKVLITGESGKGKSSLAKLLAGDLIPDRGKLYCLDDSTQYPVASAVAYADQAPHVFEMPLAENISLYRSIDQEAIDALLASLALKDIDASKNLHQDNAMSGGQKIRLSVARALLAKAPISIFDEPTAALDAKTAQVVMEMITSLEGTVICISHERDPAIASLFDRSIAL